MVKPSKDHYCRGPDSFLPSHLLCYIVSIYFLSYFAGSKELESEPNMFDLLRG